MKLEGIAVLGTLAGSLLLFREKGWLSLEGLELFVVIGTAFAISIFVGAIVEGIRR